jgi:hypothetical protein
MLRLLVRPSRWVTVAAFLFDQAAKVGHEPIQRRLPPSGLERGHQLANATAGSAGASRASTEARKGFDSNP